MRGLLEGLALEGHLPVLCSLHLLANLAPFHMSGAAGRWARQGVELLVCITCLLQFMVLHSDLQQQLC